MNIKEISRRLDALQEIADRNRPCKITVLFTDGTTTTTDPAGAWALCHEHMLTGDIADVTADRYEYDALACTIAALCRPARNSE